MPDRELAGPHPAGGLQDSGYDGFAGDAADTRSSSVSTSTTSLTSNEGNRDCRRARTRSSADGGRRAALLEAVSCVVTDGRVLSSGCVDIHPGAQTCQCFMRGRSRVCWSSWEVCQTVGDGIVRSRAGDRQGWSSICPLRRPITDIVRHSI